MVEAYPERTRGETGIVDWVVNRIQRCQSYPSRYKYLIPGALLLFILGVFFLGAIGDHFLTEFYGIWIGIFHWDEI